MMKFCPRCNAYINRDTISCPECGYDLHSLASNNNKKTKTAIAGIALAVIATYLIMSSNVISLYDFHIDDSTKKITEQVKEQVESAKKVVTEVPTTIQKSSEDSEKKINEIIKSVPNQIVKPSYLQDELVQHALEKINEDREKAGLEPVLLSNNEAAQVHANDVLKTGEISHWMTNGEKPYMTFTRYGGTGDVSQNVAISSCTGFGCNTDPVKEIEKAEYAMVHDDASSNWGHRDNILRPYHTHVSLGIAYADNFFVLVQNFEDNYIEFLEPISQTSKHVQIIGNLKQGKLLNIGIFYDQYPSPSLYEMHKNDGYYEMGDLVAVVERPLPPTQYYNTPSGYNLIVANSWSEKGQSISLDFDMSSIASTRGVYTIGVWITDGKDEFLVTSHSVFVE